MSRGFSRWIGLLIAVAILPSAARAANDIWDNTPGGDWSNGANWTDGSKPTISDSATFNLAQTYQVTFNVDPGVIQALSVSTGSVTFLSSGGAQTLRVTAGAGSQDIVVGGATTTLRLGTNNNPFHITAGDDLSIQSGATLAVLFGSDLTANDLGSGLNGTLRVDGAGSLLTLGGNVTNWVGSLTAGSLLLQNGSTGNSINADLGIASTLNTGTTGTVSIAGGSTLVLGGNLTMASQNVTGQSATLALQGTNSNLMQGGVSAVTVGSAANGAATISIGTTASGASFTTGTGLFTINKTGTVTIGGGVNTGELLLGGDVKIDGGALTKASAGSALDFAAGKTITIQNGGRLSIAGLAVAETNQVFNVSGTSSKIESTGTGGCTIGTGAQVNLLAAAALNVAGRIQVANAAGTGTLTATGEGTTVTAGTELSQWGHSGGVATITLSNKAVATLSSGIDLANSATAGTTATVSLLTGAVLNTGNLNLAAAGGTTTAATLHINGTNSAVTQAGAATLTVGHESEGAAAIHVGTANDGGTLTTGSGPFRINKTGRVTIGAGQNAGALNVLGNILVDGGVLEQDSAESMFSWTTGKTLTIQNAGRVHFASTYTSAPNAIHAVIGAGSKFEIVGALHIRSAGQVNVTSGGTLEASEFHVGGGGAAGTLSVDGAGSKAIGGSGAHRWGSGGNAAVTISNGATGTLGGSLALAESAAATVQVLSGADLTSGDLSIASAGGAVNGALNVVGAGSTVNVSASSNVAIGHATSGTGALNIDDGGSFAVGAGGTTTINGTGTVNIAAGTADLAALSVIGGMVNVNGGTLRFASLSFTGGAVKFNAGRIEQSGNLAANEALLTALIGPTHEVPLGRTLAAAAGTATLTASADLNGGRLEGNALSVANAGLHATTLRLRNGGTAQATDAASLAAGTTIFIENGGSLLAGGVLNQSSELTLSGTGRVAASALVNTGLVKGSGRVDANLNNQAVGQIRLADDERLVLRGTSHQNNGLVDVDHAEFEAATGSFINGTANPSTATISVRDGILRFTGGLTNAGSIVCSEGTCDFYGDVTNVSNQPTTGRIVVTASSQATFFGNVVNRGTIQVSAAGQVGSTALFLGSLSGNGVTGSGSVFLEGDVRPGGTIGTMAFGGDVSIGSAATVRMELAGATVPQYDRIAAAASLALGGTLDVTLAAGFMPTVGQSFDLFDWGTRSGVFASINLPTIAGIGWNTSQLYTTGVISVTSATALAGDFNGDGRVDAADYTQWRDGLGSAYDMDDYQDWKMHFGQSAGAAMAVPEPASCAMFVVAILGAAARRQARLVFQGRGQAGL